jgi:hypothetical protein
MPEEVGESRDTELPPLIAGGDAREVGIALGRHAAPFLHKHLRERLGDLFGHRNSAYFASLLNETKMHFPELYEELEGVAAGADISLTDICLLNFGAELVPRDSDGGCTTLMLPPSPPSGAHHSALIAHNEDMSLTLPGAWFIAQIARNGRPSFTSMCYAGKLPGTAFSVNSHGLVQTINDIRLSHVSRGVPRGILARAVLDCPDAADAIALIGNVPRASGYHHTIASPARFAICSVEATPAGVVAKAIQQATAHANHLLYEPLSRERQNILGGSRERQSLASSLLKEAYTDPLAVLQAPFAMEKGLLQTPSPRNEDHKTVVSSVFKITGNAVEWDAYRHSGAHLTGGAVRDCRSN